MHPVSALLPEFLQDSPAPHAFIEHQQCTRQVLGPGHKEKIKALLLRTVVLVKERKCGGSSGVREGFAKEVILEPGLEGMEFITQKGFPRKRNCEERWKGTNLRGGMNSEVSSGRPEGGEPGGVGRRQGLQPGLIAVVLLSPADSLDSEWAVSCPLGPFPTQAPHPGPPLGAPLTRNTPFPQIFLSSKMQLLCHLF